MNPIEIVGRFLVTMTSPWVCRWIVEHHLARSHLLLLVNLPEDSVPLFGVANEILRENFVYSILLIVRPWKAAQPLAKVVIARI